MAVDPATVLFGTAAATATVGSVVAALAYRGARRNDSETMRYLSAGIVCVAVLPFLVNYGLTPIVSLSDAEALLGVLAANVVGLSAMIYSLEA